MPIRLLRFLAPLLPLLAGLPGCSGADIVNALTPAEGYRVLQDIPYGEGPRRRLDVYLPDKAPARLPTVVFFYGGGWTDGSKADYRFVGQAFASRGYALVIADYRLYPEARYPAFLDDGAAAVAWVKRRMAAETGVAPQPIYFVGHSAGAYNAAMLLYDPRWLAAQDLRACDVASAFAGLAGPYDFRPVTGRTLLSIFGDPTPPDMMPADHVKGDEPPALLIVGATDSTVSPRNSERFATKIREKGGSVELKSYADIDHLWLVGALASPLRSVAPTLDDVDAFLKKQTRNGCEP